MKVITIGSATYDILVSYTDADTIERITPDGKKTFLLLQEGKKSDIDSIYYKTGGGATNSAVSFGRLGFDVEAFFKIGDDYQGRYILETLAHEHIGTTYVQKSPTESSSASCIISGKSGNRSVLVARGAARTMQKSELPLDACAHADCVYVSALSGNGISLLPLIAQTAHSNTAIVAVNPGSGQLSTSIQSLHAALPYIDIFMLNASEAQRLLQSLQAADMSVSSPTTRVAPGMQQLELLKHGAQLDLIHYFATIHALGPRIVVVTNGKEGVYVSDTQRILFHPSLPIKITSTLGAGDAFGSAFTAGIVQGKPIETAIRMGIVNSSSVVQHTDAKTGLLTSDQMDKQLALLAQALLIG